MLLKALQCSACGQDFPNLECSLCPRGFHSRCVSGYSAGKPFVCFDCQVPRCEVPGKDVETKSFGLFQRRRPLFQRRRPLTLQVPSTRPSCTLAMPRTSSTCRSLNLLLSIQPARRGVPLQNLSWIDCGKLPSGLTVWHPTSCPWSPNSACSSVDVNKLHFGEPRPGSTGSR